MKIVDGDEGKESFEEGTMAWLYIFDVPSFYHCYYYYY
mgnify:CR=1 FL=1